MAPAPPLLTYPGVCRYKAGPRHKVREGPRARQLAELHVDRMKCARERPPPSPPRLKGLLRFPPLCTQPVRELDEHQLPDGELLPPQLQVSQCTRQMAAVVSHRLGSATRARRRELLRQRVRRRDHDANVCKQSALDTRKRVARVQPVVRNKLDSRLEAARGLHEIDKLIAKEKQDTQKQIEDNMHVKRVRGARQNGRLDRHSKMQARAHEIAKACAIRAAAVVQVENANDWQHQRRYDRFS